MTTYTPKREKRYDEIIAEGRQHEPMEVMKAMLTDLVLAEACLRERDAEIAELKAIIAKRCCQPRVEGFTVCEAEVDWMARREVPGADVMHS